MTSALKRYVCSYTFRGDRWCFYLAAQSHEEAAHRLAAVAMTGHVDGECAAEIPVTPPGFWQAVRRFYHVTRAGAEAAGVLGRCRKKDLKR